MDLRELLAIPGVKEECVLRSPVGFMALHGGSQDRGTDAIARRVAEECGASLYAIVQPPELRLHLTSHRHDPDQSTVFRGFLDHIRIAISIHGFGRDTFSLWTDPTRGLIVEPYGPPDRGAQTGPLTGVIVGGLNPELVQRARTLFSEHCPGFHVADERVRLGFHPKNPVNLPSEHGVQLELPPGLRGIGPYGEHLTPDAASVPEGLFSALRELAHGASRLVDGATSPSP
jgi:phage replication-related protein YjqB (UPF0714/DUF867 family)